MPQSPPTLLARFDRLPIWPYPYYVLLAIGAGFFFAFFDVVSIGLVLPVIEQQFAITASVATWAITSSLAGYILGSFLDGRLSDWLGRRVAMYASIAFVTLGSLLCAFSPNIDWLVVGRFITGMGIGAEIAVVTALMSELAPARCRGKCTSMAVAFGMLGFAIVPFVGMSLIPHSTWGWRALFLIATVSGVAIAFTRLFVPESPRWLLAKGRVAEAESLVDQAEAFVLKKGIALSAVQPDSQASPAQSDKSGFRQLFQRAYFPYLLLFVVIWFVYYVGNYAWLTLGTSLFVDKGFSLAKSLAFVALSSTGFVAGSIIPIVWGDRFERKYFACVLLLSWSLALALMGWWPTTFVLVGCGFIASATISAVIPILYAYTAEHFPTMVRTTGVSITDGLGHLGGAICGQVVLGVYTLCQPHGFAAAFSTMALTGVISALCVLAGKRVTGLAVH